VIIDVLNGWEKWTIAEGDSAEILPIIPDAMYYTDVGQMGDRVVLRVRNTTGGNLMFRAIAQITQL